MTFIPLFSYHECGQKYLPRITAGKTHNECKYAEHKYFPPITISFCEQAQ